MLGILQQKGDVDCTTISSGVKHQNGLICSFALQKSDSHGEFIHPSVPCSWPNKYLIGMETQILSKWDRCVLRSTRNQLNRLLGFLRSCSGMNHLHKKVRFAKNNASIWTSNKAIRQCTPHKISIRNIDRTWQLFIYHKSICITWKSVHNTFPAIIQTHITFMCRP